MMEETMSEVAKDLLTSFSDALAERARLARPLVVKISAHGNRMRSGVLWRKGVAVASEQDFPDAGETMITVGDGRTVTAQIAGRDPGTNVIAFRFESDLDPAPLSAAEPRPGALVLAYGAAEDGVAARLGVIHSVAPAWHSRAGGKIDRRIVLDIRLARREEGGPVLDASGGLLGMSTLGPRGRVLVIPRSTIDNVIDPLISKGRIERGWLGVALQPVLVPETFQSEAGQSHGLIVMGVSRDGPAAQASLQVGDIILSLGGETVASPAAIARLLGPEAVGQQIEIRLIRAGAPQTIKITIGVRPEQ
jgi:S1-C subfamily serine protease